MIETNKELKIEIGPISPESMSYDNAMLYCFSFNLDGKIGWRMPRFNEYIASNAMGWYVHDDLRHTNELYPVTPVRDLKDD
jgi:hypothetical protein